MLSSGCALICALPCAARKRLCCLGVPCLLRYGAGYSSSSLFHRRRGGGQPDRGGREAAAYRPAIAQPADARSGGRAWLRLMIAQRPKASSSPTAGRVFLPIMRASVLLQIEAAKEATRRAAAPAKATFVIGFLTGYEFEWLTAGPAHPARRAAQQPKSSYSACHLPNWRTDWSAARSILRSCGGRRMRPASCSRADRGAADRVDDGRSPAGRARRHYAEGYRRAGAGRGSARQVPGAPCRHRCLRGKIGIDLTPDHLVDNLSMAVSLVASTGGVALMPLYARNLLPPTVISRPLAGWRRSSTCRLGYSEPIPRLS